MVQTATTPDGDTVAFNVHNQASTKTPIVTVHGLVSSIHHWGFFTPYFADQRPVLSWEYRGHGGGPVPREPEGASVMQFAEDAHTVWLASDCRRQSCAACRSACKSRSKSGATRPSA